MLFLKKSWIYLKNYWWFPIGALCVIIWFCARNNKNKADIIDIFVKRKEMAKKELEATQSAFEEQKKINKAYSDALKKVAANEKKSVREIKKLYKDKLKTAAKRNRGNKERMARELAERHGLNL